MGAHPPRPLSLSLSFSVNPIWWCATTGENCWDPFHHRFLVQVCLPAYLHPDCFCFQPLTSSSPALTPPHLAAIQSLLVATSFLRSGRRLEEQTLTSTAIESDVAKENLKKHESETYALEMAIHLKKAKRERKKKELEACLP